MTVVDFRSGGFDSSHRGAGNYAEREYVHGSHSEADWTDDHDWDESRFATVPDASLTEQDTLVGRVARLTHYLGALISVLLMISLVVWGYKLVVRDVSGVPVIRAVAGESRTAPEEPGGQLTERSGLAVNQLAGGGDRERVAKVAIAPGPTALTADDVAMGRLGATARETALTEDIPADPNARDVIATSDAERAAAEKALAAKAEADKAAAEAAQMVADAGVMSNAPAAEAPVNEAVTDLAGERSQDTAINQALAEAGADAAPAPRPAPRPRRLASAAPATVSDASPASAITEVAEADEPAAKPEAEPAKTAAPASGGSLVQVGAFDSNAIAQSEFDRLAGRHSGLFSGKSPVVQEHKAGGRTFWRLRIAGFAGRDEARKFCAALIEAGGDCIPAAAK